MRAVSTCARSPFSTSSEFRHIDGNRRASRFRRLPLRPRCFDLGREAVQRLPGRGLLCGKFLPAGLRGPHVRTRRIRLRSQHSQLLLGLGHIGGDLRAPRRQRLKLGHGGLGLGGAGARRFPGCCRLGGQSVPARLRGLHLPAQRFKPRLKVGQPLLRLGDAARQFLTSGSGFGKRRPKGIGFGTQLPKPALGFGCVRRGLLRRGLGSRACGAAFLNEALERRDLAPQLGLTTAQFRELSLPSRDRRSDSPIRLHGGRVSLLDRLGFGLRLFEFGAPDREFVLERLPFSLQRPPSLLLLGHFPFQRLAPRLERGDLLSGRGNPPAQQRQCLLHGYPRVTRLRRLPPGCFDVAAQRGELTPRRIDLAGELGLVCRQLLHERASRGLDLSEHPVLLGAHLREPCPGLCRFLAQCLKPLLGPGQRPPDRFQAMDSFVSRGLRGNGLLFEQRKNPPEGGGLL